MELEYDRGTLEAAMALIDQWEWESGLSELLTAERKARDDDETQSSSTGSVEESDDVNYSTSSSSSPSSPAPSSPPTSQTSKKSRRRKADDDRDKQTQLSRREELIVLRRRVREMEATLASLKQGVTGQKDPNAQASGLDPMAVWQQIATRQLEHRQIAERENLQLRVEVEERIKIAKHLMRVLLRAYEQHAKEDTSAGNAKRLKVPDTSLPEESVEDQLRGIRKLYDQRETVFARAPFTGGPPVMRDVRVTDYENGESLIEVDSSWVLPFSVTETANASWKYLVRKTAQHFEGIDDYDTKNVLITKYESRAAALRFIGKFTGSCVVQRFQPEDGELPAYIAWDMLANPSDFKPMSMDGVRLHSETITRIVWADQVNGTPPPSEGTRMSLVQMYQRVHIKFAAAETPTRRRRAGALTDFMMYIVATDLKWKQEVLESLLLQSTWPSVPDDASSWTYISLALRSETTEA